MQTTRVVKVSTLLCGLAIVALAADEQLPQEAPQTPKAALQKLNNLIGGWRGTGQPRRGSTRGAWQETGDFVWEFRGDAPAINYVVTDGKLMSQARITWHQRQGKYALELTTPDKETRRYDGDWEGNRLVFVSQPDTRAEVHRLTITPLNAKRTLVLHEKRRESSSIFARVAEVGYTREGTSLAVSGSGQPECIVTGGLGTMTVSYEGKTYYVCCSGCKQAFEADPAGIIADAKERVEKEKAAKEGVEKERAAKEASEKKPQD